MPKGDDVSTLAITDTDSHQGHINLFQDLEDASKLGGQQTLATKLYDQKSLNALEDPRERKRIERVKKREEIELRSAKGAFLSDAAGYGVSVSIHGKSQLKDQKRQVPWYYESTLQKDFVPKETVFTRTQAHWKNREDPAFLFAEKSKLFADSPISLPLKSVFPSTGSSSSSFKDNSLIERTRTFPTKLESTHSNLSDSESHDGRKNQRKKLRKLKRSRRDASSSESETSSSTSSEVDKKEAKKQKKSKTKLKSRSKSKKGQEKEVTKEEKEAKLAFLREERLKRELNERRKVRKL